MLGSHLQLLVEDWLRLDRITETRKEITDLVEANNQDQLEALLGKWLEFGTAGLRARMQAGFARMNCLTVILASRSLISYALKSGQTLRSIVIGFDGRHNSRRFAELAAATFLAKGIRVHWYGEETHTPCVPWGVKMLRTDAGIMITASHNPKDDNGYKVYWSNGAQLNLPLGEEIPWESSRDCKVPTWDVPNLEPFKCPVGVQKGYVEAASSSVRFTDALPVFVYTAMHGVGLRHMQSVFQEVVKKSDVDAEIIKNMVLVQEQALPDPEFPTVKFPNPEEAGALDLAKGVADQTRCKLIIANDPDADRLAVAEKIDGSQWYQFTGDEVGALLGYHVFKKAKSAGKLDASAQPVLLTTAVSSQFLAAIGRIEGFVVEETLTGFKWLGNRTIELEKEGQQVLLAYEEALGYMLPHVVYDKDGVAAAMTMLEACCEWPNQSPFQALQELKKRCGYFETMNTYWKSPTVELTKELFERIRKDPSVESDTNASSKPRCRFRDLGSGTDTGTLSGCATLPKSSMMLTVWLEGDDRFADSVRYTIRASGTEPKIKVYIECQSKQGEEAALDGAKATLRAIRSKWFMNPVFNMDPKYASVVADT